MNFDNSTNMFLQDKGGIGKTLTASIFMQYLREKGVTISGVDIDQQSPKLSTIKELNVPLVPLLSYGEIKQSSFDPLFRAVVQSKTATAIDAGSGAFLPLLKYMSDMGCYDLLQEAKKQLYYHIVVISGPEKQKTAEGAKTLLEKVRGTATKVIIWQNEKEGIHLFDGKAIEETDWYKAHSDRIVGVVKIIDNNNSAYKESLLAMMEEGLTYRQIMAGESATFDFMAQNRIRRIFTSVYAELDAVFKTVPATAKERKAG